MRLPVQLIFLSLLCCCPLSIADGTEPHILAMRSSFLQAEQYIKQDRADDYHALADALKDYPLYPYLQFQWLNKHLNDSQSIQNFLHDYPDSRYAVSLHREWLLFLAKQQQWPLFLRHYRETQDETLQCYFAQAQYQFGLKTAALETASRFWSSGKTLPAACNELLEWLKQSQHWNQDSAWQAFQAALSNDQFDLAKRLLNLFDSQNQIYAQHWLEVHSQPQKIRQFTTWQSDLPHIDALLLHGLKRWIALDLSSALQFWEHPPSPLPLAQAASQDIEKHFALALALSHDPRALDKLSRYAGDDPVAQAWRVRAALNQQNWPAVLTAIDQLPAAERQHERWQYWQAKALLATGQAQAAQSLFEKLATQRSFYGFLAADYLQRPIELGHQPLLVPDQDIDELKNRPDFLAIKELLNINRRTEANRQWWHATAHMSPQQLKAAAKLARQWQWPAMTIFTLAQAQQWDDLTLRFPLEYPNLIQSHAEKNALPPAWLLALIRQESAFDAHAGSAAGAIGLMQVMPNTAKQIAHTLKQNWQNDNNLLDADINIRFGSLHFKQLLDRFHGHWILATAAYNAGEQRVKKWLPTRSSLPADIWIETIPYKETRNYVSSVLMYALIYQNRLNLQPLKITDLMHKINPD